MTIAEVVLKGQPLHLRADVCGEPCGLFFFFECELDLIMKYHIYRA